MTKQQILEMTGLSEKEFYNKYPDQQSFMMEYGGMIEEYKKGGWIQKATASIKKRGTEGKCTPMSKPGCTGRALALAKTFHKMAAKRKKKEEGGYVDMYADGGKLPEGILRARLESHMSPDEAQDYINNYAQGGVVDAYQLMGMPTPSMYGMGSYAMGGQVNYPQGLRKNMGNMPIFAMGGMTGAPIDINVARGELLIDPKTGKILTEYKGGGMVPHPEYGMDERGTVPAQEGKFVIPVKYKMGGMTYAERYKKAWKENDKDLMNALKNNTAYRKAKSEAKEEAEASKMMAKYGGAIQRMMAKGGMVPMYQDGNTVVGPQLFSQMYPGGMYPNQTPYAMEQEEDWGGNMTNPVTEFGNYLSTQRGQARSMANMQPSMQSRGISQVPISPIDMSPKQGPYTGPGSKLYINTGMPIETFDVSNITGLDPGQYPNRVPYRVEGKETWRGMAENTGTGTGTGKGMNNWGQYLPMITSLGMGLEAALQKPFNMNPEDYKIKGKLSSYDTPYQTDYRPYALTKYNLRQVGNAGPAGYTALYNAFAAQEAKNKLANRETNLARKMQADQVNLGIEGQNINTAMQIAMSNEQNKAARRNAIREQFGKNLPASFYNQQANQITMQALKAAYPDYNFDFGIFS
jgi:hypothetical protein